MAAPVRWRAGRDVPVRSLHFRPGGETVPGGRLKLSWMIRCHEATMTPARVWLSVLGIGLLSTSVLIGQAQAPAAPNAPPAPNAPIFRVGVDIVRIDAVVTDRDGRVVPDLTADDFELRQDGDLIPLTLAAVRSRRDIVGEPGLRRRFASARGVAASVGRGPIEAAADGARRRPAIDRVCSRRPEPVVRELRADAQGAAQVHRQPISSPATSSRSYARRRRAAR